MKGSADGIIRNAHFSPDRACRYALSRVWDKEKRRIGFVGLNPSSANEKTDDYTIRKLIHFAKDWGFGGFYIVNLFPRVSPYPNILPVFKLNRGYDGYMSRNRQIVSISLKHLNNIVFMWGASEYANGLDKWFIDKWPAAYCFGHTKDGYPKHPLRLAYSTPLVPYLKTGVMIDQLLSKKGN